MHTAHSSAVTASGKSCGRGGGGRGGSCGTASAAALETEGHIRGRGPYSDSAVQWMCRNCSVLDNVASRGHSNAGFDVRGLETNRASQDSN